MLRTRPLSTRNYLPFPQDHLHLQPLQPQFLEYFIPQRSIFETNPKTCFVHDLCPPTTASLFPRIISICNHFNLNFLNISAHNEAYLRLTLKYVSYTASAHPQLPPFPPGSSPSATPSTSISWIFQPTTKACLRSTLKYASFTTSVRPQLPPFFAGSSPSTTPSKSISWKFQFTTKYISD